MNIDKLIAAALEIERRYNKRIERVDFMRRLAADARRTGKSQSHRMSQAPEVVDFGGPIEALVKALRAKPGKKKKPENRLFCANHVKTQNNQDGLDCLAHMAEGRVFSCPHKEPPTKGQCLHYEPR